MQEVIIADPEFPEDKAIELVDSCHRRGVTVQVAATSISPRTMIALTAEPGASGSGCFSLLDEPTPITGVIPAAAKFGANCLIAASLNPLKTNGASIGWRYCA